MGRILSRVTGALAVLTALGILLLWPRHDPARAANTSLLQGKFYDGRIEVLESNRLCTGAGGTGPDGSSAGAEQRCPQALVEVLSGPDEGARVIVDLPAGFGRVAFEEGDKVVLSPAGTPGRYAFADRQRKPVLFWLAIVFAVAVVALGRLRGLAALAGLAASLLVLLVFILPAILDGRSPVLVAVVGASAIAFVAIYTAHGFRPLTTVAVLGTLASLALTVFLAVLVTGLAGLTGYASEEATIIQLARGRIDLSGLVLAGIVIGALGAIDDMTVTQASVVGELHSANPNLGRRGLFRSAMTVGRDHVASTVNTLALAYAGASIPLLLLFVLSEQSLGTVVNGEVVATEVVRTLVGSIGLVMSVPITTWLAARVTARPDAQGPSGPSEREGGGPSGPSEREGGGPSGPAPDQPLQ